MAPVYDEWDRGSAWLMLLLCFILQVLVASSFSTFGIYMVEYLMYFQCSKVTVSWVGAVLLSLAGLAGMVVGQLLDKFGFRVVCIFSTLLSAIGYISSAFVHDVHWLYLTHGLLASAGIGCWGVCANTVVLMYFKKRRGMANATAMSGLSIGVLFWSSLTQFLIASYTWRGAILIMGAICLHGVPIGLLLRKPIHRPEVPELPAEPKQTLDGNAEGCPLPCVTDDIHYVIDPYGSASLHNKSEEFPSDTKVLKPKPKILDFSVLRDRPFAIYFVATIFVFLAHYVPFTFIPLRAESLGISKARVAFVISMLGLVGGVCRIVFGWISDFPRVHRMLMFGVAALLTGMTTTVSVLFTSFGALAGYCSLYAVLSAVYTSIMFRLVSDLIGMEKLSQGIGFMFFAIGFAMLLSSPIGGALVDTSGDTGMPFLVFGIIEALGGAIALLTIWYNRRYRPHDRYFGPNGNALQAT